MPDTQHTGQKDLVFYSLGALLLCVSLFIRTISYPIQTSDYQYFVKVWYGLLASQPGLSAFKTVFANYAPLYLYFLKGLTYLSTAFGGALSPLLGVKLLSAAFDVIIALIICGILRAIDKERFTRSSLFLSFAIVFSIPTLILNSSLWAQCDALYAAGVLGSLYYIVKDKPLGAALAYAFAFCLKLQAIFFLPIIVGYLLAKRGKALYLLFVPGLFALSIVPAWLAGGSFSSWALQYLGQTGDYSYINLNSPSVFAFVDAMHLSASLQTMLGNVGLVLAALAALALTVATFRLYFRAESRAAIPASTILQLSLLCILIIPFFLPHMHERYFYLGDVLAVLYALYDARTWFIAVLAVGASFFAYLFYLAGYVPFFGKMQLPLWAGASAILLSLLVLLISPLVSARLARYHQRRPIRFPARSLQF